LAASTASIAKVRIVLIDVCSTLSAMVDMKTHDGCVREFRSARAGKTRLIRRF
jgi:hypothetical protein